MSDEHTMIDGTEVFRCESDRLWSETDKFHLAVRIVALLNHLPAVQREGGNTVLYAIRRGLIRKLKPINNDPSTSPPRPEVPI